jgi:hypothetical protein
MRTWSFKYFNLAKLIQILEKSGSKDLQTHHFKNL